VKENIMTPPTLSSFWSYAAAAVLTLGVPTLVTAQNLRALAREHALINPGTVMTLTAAPGDYLPKTFEELSTESDVVVQGKLVLIKSYLGGLEDRVLSDYRLVAPVVVAEAFSNDPSQTPKLGAPLTITVWGGNVEIDGVQLSATDNNREPIVPGQDYLLFLRRSRQQGPSLYEIYYGGVFEISGTRLKPLLKKGREVFEGSQNASLPDVVGRVQNAKRR
jgi:hypothetical protein